MEIIEADTLVAGAMLVTMDATRRVIRDGALAMAGGRIVAVGPRDQVEGRSARARWSTGAALLARPASSTAMST
jgi:cytosine/adenosine deaminase-related metal-dependent hydrolase